MKIKIAARYRPFSHLPGSSCLLPCTAIEVEAFPSLLRFWDLSGAERKSVGEYPLDVVGPVAQFTLQQDLEKGSVAIWGHAKNGYYFLQLTATAEGIAIATRGGKEQLLPITHPFPPATPFPRTPLFGLT